MLPRQLARRNTRCGTPSRGLHDRLGAEEDARGRAGELRERHAGDERDAERADERLDHHHACPKRVAGDIAP